MYIYIYIYIYIYNINIEILYDNITITNKYPDWF